MVVPRDGDDYDVTETMNNGRGPVRQVDNGGGTERRGRLWCDRDNEEWERSSQTSGQWWWYRETGKIMV